MTRPTYTVTATRSGDWWALVADLGHRNVSSQAKRLDQADEMIREAIAMVLDVDEDTFDVDLVPQLRPDLQEAAQQAAATREQYDALEAELRQRTVLAVMRLRDEGLTVRDIAELVGVTPSRVSQIAKDLGTKQDYTTAR